MKKIVIIGGCGYLGSKLYTYLSKKKFLIDTVDLEWFGNVCNPKNIKSNYNDLPKSFFNKYDVVINFAGHSTVGMCKYDIMGAFQNNITNFIALTQKLNKQKLIYASTYRLYGASDSILAKETDNFQPPNTVYDLTKKTIDYYTALTDLEFYSLRMATVNGYSPNLRINQILNSMFLNTRGKKKISTYNPYASFSILGIEDLCRAIERIILGNDQRGIYNLKSFDSNINLISKEITRVFKQVDVFVEKSARKAYHIRIDTKKFEKRYNFKFYDTPQNIIMSLIENVSEKNHIIKSR